MTNFIGRRVEVLAEVGSTNDRAAELAADPANAGVVVIAERQTAGRGRDGSAWLCPPGAGVLMSVVLFPLDDLNRPAVLTAWAAVSVAEVVRRSAGVQARIKWPNDLLVRGKKVCGILIEQRRGATVVGIGLNANQTAADFAAAGLFGAASLAQFTGRRFDTRDLANELIAQLDAEYSQLLAGELAALESCWAWRVGLLGRAVELTATDGRSILGRLFEMTFETIAIQTAAGSEIRLAPESTRSITQAYGPRT